MCGICGKLNIKGERIEPALIGQMKDALAHRGPDDEGMYIEQASGDGHHPSSVGLAHKRLSIIDLSNAGRQPMTNEDKNVWMVFNGEIYNFQELKKELKVKGHHFDSNTDCEVIIHLYEEEGMKCLDRLNGMFAFALWDSKKQALFLCRDRIGIKPLVYFWNGTSVSFASELKSILRDPQVPRDINWEALNLYLTLNYIPAPYTIFENINKLNPGSYAVIKDGNLTVEKYWDVESEQSSPKERSDRINSYKEGLYHLLEDAVKIRMVADVPLGAFLSGGIDSSIIVGLMSRVSPSKVSTFSIGYQDMPLFDETHYAREVAQFNNTDHHEIKLHSHNIRDCIMDLLCWFDEPFADSSAIPTFIVSRETKRKMQVALSGDGGDELFAGYRMYTGEYWYSRYKIIPKLLRKRLIEPLGRLIPDSRDKPSLEKLRRVKKFLRGAHDRFEDRYFLWNEIFSEELRMRLIGQKGVTAGLGKTIMEERLNAFEDDSLNRMLYADLTQSLPNDMLNKVDWMSMKNALEVRVPLLDHRVVEFAFNMPGDLKMRHGKGKYILLETFKDILPKSLLNRPKMGFEIPISKWLKTDLKFLIDDYLSKERIQRQKIFNYEPIEQLIHDLFSGHKDTSWQIWNLIVFQVWYSQLNLSNP